MTNSKKGGDLDSVRSFRDLKAWQEPQKLAVQVYQATKGFPKEEMFGLTNQMRRCAVSVPSNIAEGFNRMTNDDKVHFYAVARSSVAELQSQILLAEEIGYLNELKSKSLHQQAKLSHKLINGLIKSTHKRKEK